MLRNVILANEWLAGDHEKPVAPDKEPSVDSEPTKKGKAISLGWAKPDDPIYTVEFHHRQEFRSEELNAGHRVGFWVREGL